MTLVRSTSAVVAALLLTGSASCSSPDPTPPPRPSTSPSPSPTPSPTQTASAAPATTAPPTLQIPPVTRDEISRVVYSAKGRSENSTLHARARADLDYSFRAACVATAPGQVIKYSLRSATATATTEVMSGDVPCDGTITQVGTPLPATAIQIQFDSDLGNIISAYALIVPASAAG